jgi:hypothetical protein
MPWREFPRELTAGRPAAVIKSRFQPDFYDDEKLVKFLLLEPVEEALPNDARVRVSVNGAVAAEVDLAKPKDRVVYLRKWLMKSDAEGMLTIELRRLGNNPAGSLKFDRIVLGGGMQLGIDSEKNSANEFGSVWTKIGQFTFGDTNTQHCMQYLMPRTYNASVNKLSVAFNIPSAVFDECKPKFESRIKNQKGISPQPFSATLNGVAAFETAGLATSSVFEVPLDKAVLHPGLNVVTFMNDTEYPSDRDGSTVQLYFDYFRINFEDLTKRGMSIRLK